LDLAPIAGQVNMKLTIVIPCYNEENTILEILQRVRAVDLGDIEKEIIVVDDFSTDNTRELLRNSNSYDKLLLHDRNMGKGRALRTGFAAVTGDIVIVQDADLEYDPEDYRELIEPIVKGEAQVVYGSRNLKPNEFSYKAFQLGGKLVTLVANILYGSKLTDEPTCYKVFSAELLRSIPLSCERFEFCPEVTAKVLKRGIKIVEKPISYYPRRKEEGKKINWRDGIQAIMTLLRHRFTD
jgi:glycosyltransferase involved in cell wall biosynthesis